MCIVQTTCGYVIRNQQVLQDLQPAKLIFDKDLAGYLNQSYKKIFSDSPVDDAHIVFSVNLVRIVLLLVVTEIIQLKMS